LLAIRPGKNPSFVQAPIPSNAGRFYKLLLLYLSYKMILRRIAMDNRRPAVLADERKDMIKTEKSARYINPLNRSLGVFFKNAVSVSIKNPSQALYFLQTVRNQRKASGIRAAWRREGVQVPPIMIMSITNRCNLHCKGCYHQAMRDLSKAEMSGEKLRGVIAEARDLGVSFIVLAGGEPLVRQDILDITRDFPDIIFLMFTNGLLINDEMVARFRDQKNIVPLISLEGREGETDERRGGGVYSRLQGIIRKVKKQDVFFGTSLTLTRTNFETIMNETFIRELTGTGCKLLLFVEYTPIKEGTEDWVITGEQRNKLAGLINAYRAKYPALFVSVPGDEKDFGGCLSAGRGFIHISAEGDVEPCPFAPYSDSNLRDKSLKEALQSDFLKAIREGEEHLNEGGGGCALFAGREWVRAVLNHPEK
jgi:MoaA/NifB/PqqE/SkfB family radical SAM enzyme